MPIEWQSAMRINLKTNSLLLSAIVLCATAGCFRISVAPSCPSQMDVGETAPVSANPMTPGEIPTYSWSVTPAGAGSFANDNAALTTFNALAPGVATLTVVGSDGLFQDVGECVVTIGGDGALVIALFASPSSPSTGEQVELTCGALAGSPDTLTIDQLNGPSVALTSAGSGVSIFTPDQTGVYTFRCIGEADGAQSDPATVTVSVSERDDGGGGRGDR